MRIDVRILSRAVTEIAFRGCVPHLPVPGCWPDRGRSVPRPCFPSLDTLAGGRAGVPKTEAPRSNRGTGARRR
jgi:hypothetical protein